MTILYLINNVKGFTVSAGVPKMGQLQNAAWTLSDTCTFKIMNVQTQIPIEKTNREERAGSSGSSLCKLD